MEDDENKRYQLKDFVDSLLPKSEVVATKSLQSGLKEILHKKYDLIILDMTMPTYDIDINENGGRIQPLAGTELLCQMERRELKIPVIVVTQFDRFGTGKDSTTLQELNLQLRQNHPQNYRGYVYYSTALAGWKQSLRRLIRQTLKETGYKSNV